MRKVFHTDNSGDRRIARVSAQLCQASRVVSYYHIVYNSEQTIWLQRVKDTYRKPSARMTPMYHLIRFSSRMCHTTTVGKIAQTPSVKIQVAPKK